MTTEQSLHWKSLTAGCRMLRKSHPDKMWIFKLHLHACHLTQMDGKRFHENTLYATHILNMLNMSVSIVHQSWCHILFQHNSGFPT